MSYRVDFTPRALKEFNAQERPIRDRVLRALTRLATDPYQSPGVKALQGGGYRLRVGDLRVLYIIENERLVVSDIFLPLPVRGTDAGNARRRWRGPRNPGSSTLTKALSSRA